ncbi:GNAT family N-acetyltransferase [uncultured Bacteroides sp.]|uniref:GNAT family N-acetyltransferase n=1 Tax=uncultured Bacteroides sp. TaxID=162156 RepID=UPI002AABC818|nr:GNAT family N-acetyltransferase [uncultured Bacteroides sp.]
MKKSYLVDDRIFLRAIEPEDLDIIYEMENNPSFWSITNLTVPYSRYVIKEYIANTQSDMFADKQLRLMIVCKEGNKVIGTIDITDYVPLHGRGGVGIAILEEFRNQGLAFDAMNLLCEYAFNFLHMKQLYAHIPSENEASLNLFTSCGFVRSGLLKEWLHTDDNTYADVVLMQYINPNS